MRITTWNINGLRAVLTKGLLESVRSLDADVLCLQEIKARPDQLDQASLGAIQSLYPHIIWNPALRPGYSGTATLGRLAPQSAELGLRIDEDGEGRLIASFYPDFWLFNIYFPNGGRDQERVPYKLEFYARLLDLCDRMHAEKQNLILCGDFNIAHQEIDLRHPRENANSTGFLPEERLWIDHYLGHGFIDVFRRLYPERVEYTWWTYMMNARKNNVGWRLDYFLVSENMLPRVADVETHSAVFGSDHCPVTLILKN